eukprot:48636-Alexandrium_andersonii.AAC.2
MVKPGPFHHWAPEAPREACDNNALRGSRCALGPDLDQLWLDAIAQDGHALLQVTDKSHKDEAEPASRILLRMYMGGFSKVQLAQVKGLVRSITD